MDKILKAAKKIGVALGITGTIVTASAYTDAKINNAEITKTVIENLQQAPKQQINPDTTANFNDFVNEDNNEENLKNTKNLDGNPDSLYWAGLDEVIDKYQDSKLKETQNIVNRFKKLKKEDLKNYPFVKNGVEIPASRIINKVNKDKILTDLVNIANILNENGFEDAGQKIIIIDPRTGEEFVPKKPKKITKPNNPPKLADNSDDLDDEIDLSSISFDNIVSEENERKRKALTEETNDEQNIDKVLTEKEKIEQKKLKTIEQNRIRNEKMKKQLEEGKGNLQTTYGLKDIDEKEQEDLAIQKYGKTRKDIEEQIKNTK